MSSGAFQRCLALTLEEEGGYVNHPRDPGGATNFGITQATYDEWRRAQGVEPRSVRMLEPHERDTIYRSRYWDVIRGDDLPAGIDYAVFDAAVNSGPARAARWLQEALHVPADGVIGPVTLEAARKADATGVIRRMCALRLAFVRGLDTWSTFGRGWQRRIASVETAALAMASPPPIPKPRPTAPLGSGLPSLPEPWRSMPWLAAAVVVAVIVYTVATRIL